MKKTKIVLSIITVVLLASCITVMVFASNIFSKNTLDWSYKPWNSFVEVVDDLNIESNSEKIKIDVPVYFEKDILFETNALFYLGRDAGFYNGLNSMPNEAGAILATYPTEAIRMRDDGSVYTIYDTDTGYRLFLFFEKNNNYSIPVGYPIVINDLLSFSDFSELKTGDSIENVEKIDSVATLHKKIITDVWKLEPQGASYFAENGHPCTSIHYLTDGILKIEYEMTESGELFISEIEFSEDYILTDILGNKICYKINDVDLPINMTVDFSESK